MNIRSFFIAAIIAASGVVTGCANTRMAEGGVLGGVGGLLVCTAAGETNCTRQAAVGVLLGGIVGGTQQSFPGGGGGGGGGGVQYPHYQLQQPGPIYVQPQQCSVWNPECNRQLRSPRIPAPAVRMCNYRNPYGQMVQHVCNMSFGKDADAEEEEDPLLQSAQICTADFG